MKYRHLSQHWCAACGETPWTADQLHARHIDYTPHSIVLCAACWSAVLQDRPPSITVAAVLEELYQHRYLSPQRHASLTAAG